MARFDNKVVLVSGGARGQGAAEARLLVARGAKVVIGAVLDNQGQSPAVELGPAASFVRHDVTSEADWPAPSKPPRSSAACTAWSRINSPRWELIEPPVGARTTEHPKPKSG
jgi:NAD(P)-dependent dehydrogenase (short-subunit alcohol dehydrogenase family)